MKTNLETLRHSTAHLLAAAVKELFPKTKLGIGPVIENGFYYDFWFEKPISSEDFEKIEKQMSALKAAKIPFVRIEKDIKAAKKLVKDLGEPLKAELIDDLEQEGATNVSFYQTGNFIDLCTGPHIKATSEIKAFKLLSLAAAYWKGSEKNQSLTRIYGTAWETDKELKEYLAKVELAKESDHRKIGKDLKLFTFSELVGKGLPLLTSKGATIKRVLERFIVDSEIKRGYQHVWTPPLAKADLYRTSGHYPYYKDTMYPPMIVDDEELLLRPMTCPHHFMLYKSEVHSYRELPIRLAEISPQFRYEKSGELSGLMRVRMFTLADAHIFCTPEQAESEIKNALELIDFVNETLDLKKGEDYRYRLSLGNRKDDKKYFKDDAAWDKAENTLRKVLVETKAPFYEAENEAAFYGPKIDIQMKNVLDKEETAYTVQYDFVLPQKFALTYVNEEGKQKQPVVIHRSSIGALERIMAFLIERYKGNFPVWLAPVQVVIVPIADRHQEYAKTVSNELIESGIRVEINNKPEPMQAKIRQAQLEKVPFMIILGDREQAQKHISVRTREGKTLEENTTESLIKHLTSLAPNV